MIRPDKFLGPLAIGGAVLFFMSGPVSADEPVPLAEMSGEWAGPSKLWFIRPNKPLFSDGTATVAPSTLHYTWAYKGEPQTGELTISGPSDARIATWSDTWHSPQAMTLEATEGGAPLSFLGSYSRNWGWRIELGSEADQLVMRMYNITPRGKERIAVEFIGDRQD